MLCPLRSSIYVCNCEIVTHLVCLPPPKLTQFAQGTTTNGRFLLPFRTGAFVAGKPVQPVLLSYHHARGAPQLSWETIEAPRHLFLVFSTLFHRARVVELPAYWPDDSERRDATLYAHNVRQYMVRRLTLSM